MNFIAHHYIIQPNDDPNYLLGNLLPDFGKSINISLRPKKFLSSSNPIFEGITEGAKNHDRADRQFHSSDFFKHANQCILKLFDEKKVKISKVISSSFDLIN